MADRKHASLRWNRPIQRTIIAFAAVGTVLGGAALVVVWRAMNAVREQIRHDGGERRSNLCRSDAGQAESGTDQIAIRAANAPVAALNIVAGLIMLKREVARI
jgi:hypothetical protein